MRKAINLLQEWSIPLIAGVFVALFVANTNHKLYETLVETPIYKLPHALAELDKADAKHKPAEAPHVEKDQAVAPADHPQPTAPVTQDSSLKTQDSTHHADEKAHAGHDDHHGPWFDHYLTLHFLINDIFMVLFFGIAAKEITESVLPGGALNPPSKAVNPLLGTIGGVVGPVGAFFALNYFMGEPMWNKGWGIPTATDIALAWLVARFVFGQGHPAVSFLLLLAVADDAIGLGIIAFGYPDPTNPTEWANTIWILPGMAIAWSLRRLGVKKWWPYILFGGMLSWWGLKSAHLHPALALVPIVPFLPAAPRDLGMYAEEADYEEREEKGHEHSTLENFEHDLKALVDFGLFFFAFANAGVGFSTMNNLTWVVFLSLLLGKIVGITGLSWIGTKLGAPLPVGMKTKHLFVASIIAGIGLTVALFVAGQAFLGPGEVLAQNMAASKMGALFSGGICLIAIVAGYLLKVKGNNGN